MPAQSAPTTTPSPDAPRHMRGRVTESIYASQSLVVPLADVQHIERQKSGGLVVVTRHTHWDRDGDFWANNIWVDAQEAEAFLQAWCRYRSELEADTLEAGRDAPSLLEAAKPVCDALGFAEWVCPEDAERLLREIIENHWPALKAACAATGEGV